MTQTCRDLTNRLIKQNTHIIGALAYGLNIPFEDKQDLFQELCMRVAGIARRYDSSRGAFRPYLKWCLRSWRTAFLSKLAYRWECFGITDDIYDTDVPVYDKGYEHPILDIISKYLTIDELVLVDRYIKRLGSQNMGRQKFDNRLRRIIDGLRNKLTKEIK